MKITTKENLKGRFYAEITTENNAVFKTMSFSKRNAAKKYGIEFLNTFSERVDEPQPLAKTLHTHDIVGSKQKEWTQKEVQEAFNELGFEFPENDEQLKAFDKKFKDYPHKLITKV